VIIVEAIVSETCSWYIVDAGVIDNLSSEFSNIDGMFDKLSNDSDDTVCVKDDGKGVNNDDE